MKTKMISKNKMAKLICLMATPFMAAYAQNCPGSKIAISAENFHSTSSKTVEFDVYVTNTGTTALSLAAVQGAVVYDAQMLQPNATVTFEAVSRQKGFEGLNPVITKHSADSNQLRWMQNPVSRNSKNTVDLPANAKLKFASFRLVSSQSINSSLVAKMAPQLAVKFGYTNFIATVYCNDNPNSIALKPTIPAQSFGNGPGFNAVAYPNPFTENFQLDIRTASESDIQVKVYDMLGKLIESKNIAITEIERIAIGAHYPSGIYNISILQGNDSQTLRIIKR